MELRARRFRYVVVSGSYDASVRFYKEILGLARIDGWDRDEGRGVLLSAGGRAVVEVIEGKASPSTSGVFLALEVDDADAWHRHLKGHGVEIEVPPHNEPWGHRAFTVRDPDGLSIVIYQVVVDRPTGV